MTHLPPLADLLDAALAHDRGAVAQLVSICEDVRPSAWAERAALWAHLLAHPRRRQGVTIGLTGSPGAGKSTLLGQVALALLRRQPAASLAALAIDPSSRASGGALLGDRTRTHFPPGDRRFFFRSQAAVEELGGLGPSTFDVSRLLCCLYDYLLVETVGIGQSEGDIRQLADRVILVVAPLGGDEVQFLKAGIMEVPDAFVINKCDEPSAERSYHQLRGSVWLARPFDGEKVPILRTSARSGQGVEELAGTIEAMAEAVRAARRDVGPDDGFDDKIVHFFARWVRAEFGRRGVAFLDEKLGGPAFVRQRGYDQAQHDFLAAYSLQGNTKV